MRYRDIVSRPPTYLDIGHKVGSSLVYYISRQGELTVWPYESALGDMHGASGLADQRERNAWAAGRIDLQKKIISLRDTSTRYQYDRPGFGRHELAHIAGLLRRSYPDFRILYFDHNRSIEIEESTAKRPGR